MARTNKASKTTTETAVTATDMQPDQPVITKAVKKTASTKKTKAAAAALPVNEPAPAPIVEEDSNDNVDAPPSEDGSDTKSAMVSFDDVIMMVKDNKEAVAALKKLKKVALKSSVVRRALGDNKDTSASKHRQPTAFNIFVREQMRILSENNKGLSNKEMFKECSAMWQKKKQENATAAATTAAGAPPSEQEEAN